MNESPRMHQARVLPHSHRTTASLPAAVAIDRSLANAGESTTPPVASSVRTAVPRAIANGVTLVVTLDSRMLDAFRRAVFARFHDAVQMVRVQLDPRDSSRVNVWLGLARAAVGKVFDVIVATLPEAEIGQLRANDAETAQGRLAS